MSYVLGFHFGRIVRLTLSVYFEGLAVFTLETDTPCRLSVSSNYVKSTACKIYMKFARGKCNAKKCRLGVLYAKPF